MSGLPLLDFVSRQFKTNFEKTVVIGCQHLLPSNLAMFRYLVRSGLKKENNFLIGKIYSNDKNTEKEFKKKGVYTHEYNYHSHLSFEEQFSKAVQSFLKSVNKRIRTLNFDKVIIVDDGGELVEQICANKLPSNVDVAAIEQTTFGYEKLTRINKKLPFPIINVARSKAKLDVESPFIAEAIIKETKKRLAKLKKEPKKILVVGSGAIGTNLFDQLRKNFKVDLYDKARDKSHFSENLELVIPEYDTIIGSTGATIISRNEYKLFKNDVSLISASSSDIEFDAVYLRRLVKATKDPHVDILTNGVHLLNSGFPINFNGSEVEKPRDIQLTRALMLSAIYLACEGRYRNGLQTLDPTIQTLIVKKFDSLINEN
jgi:S-adenosylhomocysteine hydrolase